MKNWTLRFRETDRDNFENVRSGIKSIETRAASVKYRSIAVGDTLTFVCGKDRFQKTITKLYHWPSIDAMVKDIPFKNVMPELDSLEAVKRAYKSYPAYEQKIREFGLLGFRMK